MANVNKRISKYWTILRWVFIVISIVLFIVAMYMMANEKDHEGPGYVFSISIIAFILGMIIFIAEYGGWISSLGLLLFFGLLVLGIILSDSGNINAQVTGGLLFPLSIFFLGGWLYWFNFGITQWKNKRLLKKGLIAKGILLSFTRTGSKITKNTDFPKYGIALEIEVKPEGKSVFRAYANEMLAENEIVNLEKGIELTVRYMEKDKENVTVRWDKEED